MNFAKTCKFQMFVFFATLVFAMPVHAGIATKTYVTRLNPYLQVLLPVLPQLRQATLILI